MWYSLRLLRELVFHKFYTCLNFQLGLRQKAAQRHKGMEGAVIRGCLNHTAGLLCFFRQDAAVKGQLLARIPHDSQWGKSVILGQAG